MTKRQNLRRLKKARAKRMPMADVVGELGRPGRGFETVQHIPGSTYKDASTVIVIPTRGEPPCPHCGDRHERTATECPTTGKALAPQPPDMGVPRPVVQSWLSLISPMNQKRAILFTSGHEVGQAYNALIEMVLAHPELSKWRYVMTIEDDNIQPPDAHIRLLESIEWGKYDAVSGLYFTKGEMTMPMAYGDPEEFKRTGKLDFRPRDVREALAAGQIMPVNGIAMGCALWRLELFREVPGPWFVTVNDVVGGATSCFTQDLHFCERAIRAGKRFAVDLRVKVGHIDPATDIVY